MDGRRATLTYLVAYLIVGGAGFALFPDVVLRLFRSTGQYGDVMPRLVGVFMCALGFLIYSILRHEDWKYYPVSIYARTGIVAFLFYLYAASRDPMLIVLSIIVLIGLLPSWYVHFTKK